MPSRVPCSSKGGTLSTSFGNKLTIKGSGSRWAITGKMEKMFSVSVNKLWVDGNNNTKIKFRLDDLSLFEFDNAKTFHNHFA